MSATQSVYSHHENAAYGQRPAGGISMPKFSMPNMASRSTDNTSESQKIGLRKNWLCSIVGICRLLLVIFLLAGWIAAAILVRDNDNAGADGYGGFTSTRIAYLVFAIAAWFIYLMIFSLELLNIFNVVAFLRRLPLEIIFLVIDIVFLLCIFSVSVACAVRENQLTSYVDAIYDTFLIGAFATAATFGFLTCIVLIILIIIQAFTSKAKRPQPGA